MEKTALYKLVHKEELNRLYAEIEQLQTGYKKLETALDSIIAQGGNLPDEALEVNGINDGRQRAIMYLNSRDIALKVLGFIDVKEWWQCKREP